MKQKKKGKSLFRNLHPRRKNFFFIYDVIVKRKKEKRSTNHYSNVWVESSIMTGVYDCWF